MIRQAPAVVLFDLDDTLFDHRKAVELGILATLRDLDRTAHAATDSAEAQRWHELEETHYHRYLSGELDYQGQRRARARDFTAPYGLHLTDPAADAWFETYSARYKRSFRLHDDALTCLDALQQGLPGVRFGIITNGDKAFQTAKLAALRLTERMEHLITSGEFGTAKPDARIFVHACERFGVAPGAAVYVGDRLRTDAIGAASAGLGGIWLNRPGTPPPVADAREARRLGVEAVRTLAEVTELLVRVYDPETAAR